MRLAAALFAFMLVASTARADDEDRARAHYEIGLGLYRLGDYRGALKEFAAGYELARKPGFLLNLGQTYRKLGQLREARDMYRQFVAQVRLDDPARLQAQKVLAELEESLRTAPPPAPPAPPAPPPAVTTPVAPAPAPAPAVTLEVAKPAPHRLRRAERISGIVVGSVGLAIAGAGIGYAVDADHTARDLNAADRAGGLYDPNRDARFATDRKIEAAFLTVGAAFAVTGAVLLIVSAR
jgi:tetratricopeptide (TPR) repeat protein